MDLLVLLFHWIVKVDESPFSESESSHIMLVFFEFCFSSFWINHLVNIFIENHCFITGDVEKFPHRATQKVLGFSCCQFNLCVLSIFESLSCQRLDIFFQAECKIFDTSSSPESFTVCNGPSTSQMSPTGLCSWLSFQWSEHFWVMEHFSKSLQTFNLKLCGKRTGLKSRIVRVVKHCWEIPDHCGNRSLPAHVAKVASAVVRRRKVSKLGI